MCTRFPVLEAHTEAACVSMDRTATVDEFKQALAPPGAPSSWRSI
ncbi:MAG TPA: hypothetical protein VMI34_24905 [Candidatus Bathyarchaeia archaeon]|nr:hypothetical protein [Candidatus Bathyarchaeia archaeon]